MGFPLPGASEDLWFEAGQYTHSVTSLLSCSRASTGYAKNSSGTWVLFGANTLRITDLGLLIEDARTNNLLNSDTPATQTTGSLATGSYILWVEGSGSALASGGSATITGASAATNGNPDAFTVTVAGTVTVTVTGALDRFQLELGGFPTSYIPTTGAAATRAVDLVSCSGNLSAVLTALPHSLVFDVDAISATHGDDTFVGSPASFQSIYDVSSDTQVRYLNSGATVFTPATTLGSSLKWSGGAKAGIAQGSVLNASLSIVGGGGIVQTALNSQAWTAPVIGSNPSFSISSANGYFRRLTVWNSTLADATLQDLTNPNSINYLVTTLFAQACL